MGNMALYIDGTLGIAGDMLSAALIGLMDDPEEFVRKLNIASPDEVTYTLQNKASHGISGYHMQVMVSGKEEDDHHHHHEHDHGKHDHAHDHHEHHSMHSIGHVIDNLKITERQKDKIREVYNILAKAESEVHGVEVKDIHFHEVGSLDAVADVMAVILALDELGFSEVYASPLITGYGTVECAHGTLPVPAPATAKILEGIPTSAGNIKGELITPTGAALIKTVAKDFVKRPDGIIRKQTKGIGSRDYGQASFVSVQIIETEVTDNKSDSIVELSFNVDDCTGEQLGLAMEMIMEAGARDVFYTPVYMKKNRPGVMVTIITDEAKEMDCVRAAFEYTTTIGMRRHLCDRYVLDREIRVEDTEDGPVRVKVSKGYGVEKRKVEFEDIRKIKKDK